MTLALLRHSFVSVKLHFLLYPKIMSINFGVQLVRDFLNNPKSINYYIDRRSLDIDVSSYYSRVPTGWNIAFTTYVKIKEQKFV